MLGGVHEVAKVTALGMSAAFNWVGLQGSNLVKRCRVSGATVIHVGASVCPSVCL